MTWHAVRVGVAVDAGAASVVGARIGGTSVGVVAVGVALVLVLMRAIIALGW